MTIDPLETIITWLETVLTKVEGRVAGKHRYGAGWADGVTGASVHLDGGSPDLYVPIATPRIEIRIYASDQVKIVEVWRELIGLSRDHARFTVSTSNGKAFVQYFKPASSLSMPYDDVLKMDVGVVFFDCAIAEDSVS
jgi:hypothetical protein